MSTHASQNQPENPDMTHLIHKIRFGMEMASGKVCCHSYLSYNGFITINVCVHVCIDSFICQVFRVDQKTFVVVIDF